LRALAQKGCHVVVRSRQEDEDLEKLNVFIFANPHCNQDLLIQAERCTQQFPPNSGKKIIIDLDRDFFHYPAYSPGYQTFGPGNPQNLKRLEALLSQAHAIIVSSSKLKEVYQPFNPSITVIPPSWISTDHLWNKPTPKRKHLHVGIISLYTTEKHIALLRDSLKRLLAEDEQILLAIGGEMGLSDAFSGISEKRKTFIPFGHATDYPYLLAHYDILLIPLLENDYDQSLSDQPLLEAGIRRVAWLASPNPAFLEWNAGGFFIEKKGDWYAKLRQLVRDNQLRAELGAAGRQKAESREIAFMLPLWENVLAS
jgi:glycosyltransferase involved in cell wall biosynthesis